ncbi:unnamed protein product [Auanema sp. JU1783]|nr:unnamed protein product [Auanema sp. JU1783]
MDNNYDDKFMERAFALAEEALKDNEVPVGCVFVHDGKEVGFGQNETNRTHNPTAHAEMNAIRQMEELIPNFRDILPELELYVTLEPCIMCASALYELGIRKIVYGAENDRFGGIRSVGNAGRYGYADNIKIINLVQADRSIDLLKQFYANENPFAPEDKKEKKRKPNECVK